MFLVKVQHNGQMTIPRSVRSAVGLADGDMVEVKANGNQIIITPQVVIDRSGFPNADGEYTAEQRRIINERLDKSDEDTKNGHIYGPFYSAETMLTALHMESKKLQAKKIKPVVK